MNKEKINQIVFDAIDTLNQQQPKDRQLAKQADTPLMGTNSFLDSFGLVSLIVEVEQGLSDQFGVEISLADENSMSQRRSPFRNVETLADYIFMRIQENEHE